jgi:predicted  nucleic acid-binding Zn-ribbon protein
MRETIQLLRGIQSLDRELFQVRSELKRLPDERSRRGARLGELQHQSAELDRALANLRARIKEIEDATTSQRQRIRKLEGECATARADTALIVAYQHEMRTLRREIGDAEEEGLGLVEQSDALTKQRAELAEQIAQEKAEFAEYDANVETELTAARAKEAELAKRREKALHAEGLVQEVLQQYEKLLEAREGEALALLDQKTCMGCHTTVPSNVYVRLARGAELVTCPSCTRILYLD